MKKISVKTVEKLASLAELDLTGEEKTACAEHIASFLKHVEKLNDIDTADISPTEYGSGAEMPLRKDTVQASLKQKEALQNCEKTRNGYVCVPGIINREEKGDE